MIYEILKAREEAIVQMVNRLLAEKGFEAMTVDEVAAQVGIAKASLYKHFSSQEKLVAAAQTAGARNPGLPAIAILYTFFARACDPVLEFTKMVGRYQDESIVDFVLGTCFDGLFHF